MQQINDGWMPYYNYETDEFVLPEVDKHYRIIHMPDKPFMLYPEEQITALEDCPNILITSYARIWNNLKREFYNNGKPLSIPKSTNTMQITIKNVKYSFHPFKFIKEHFPNSYYVTLRIKKPTITKEEKAVFVEWFEKNKEELEEYSNPEIAKMFQEATGIKLSHQTVWLYKHPEQQLKDNSWHILNRDKRKAYEKVYRDEHKDEINARRRELYQLKKTRAKINEEDETDES